MTGIFHFQDGWSKASPATARIRRASFCSCPRPTPQWSRRLCRSTRALPRWVSRPPALRTAAALHAVVISNVSL